MDGWGSCVGPRPLFPRHVLVVISKLPKKSGLWLCFPIDMLSTYINYKRIFALLLTVFCRSHLLECHDRLIIHCLHAIGQTTFQSLPSVSM